MKFYSAILSIVIVLCGFIMFTDHVQAVEYRSHDYYYSVYIPDDWIEIPQEIINESMKRINEENADLIDFEYGFQAKNTYYFDTPYLLIQSYKSKQPSRTEIMEFIGMDSEDFNKIAEDYRIDTIVLEGSSLENYYSESKNAAFVSKTMYVEGVGNLVWLLMAFVGKEGIVSFNYYCKEDNLSIDYPVFNHIINSFSFDEGYEYQEKATKNKADKVASKSMSWLIIIGLGLAISAFYNKNKKKADTDKNL